MNSLSGSMGPTGSMNRNSRTGMKKDIIPKGFEKARLAQFTPEQMQLFQQSFAHLSPDSYLARLAGSDEALFNEIEAPALKQFAGLQGDIASRFSGMGGTGARRSSGFQNYMTQGAQDFASQLQAQRQGLQRQAIQDLMGYSRELLNQRPYEQSLVEKPQKQAKPALGGWGGAVGALGGAAIGYFAGDPFKGAKIGSTALSGL